MVNSMPESVVDRSAANAKGPAQRIVPLVQRFREIGDSSMRDLPIYNQALSVEPVDFEQKGATWQGVLITPWFMNFLVLPAEIETVDWRRMGEKSSITLPSGSWQFSYGGDEVIGAYWFLSLHSPMFEFKTQSLARIEARQRLKALLTSPTSETGRDVLGNPQRRAFLQGRRTSA